ncbi:hypothetical protein [Nannocystis pusilla]|uniref:Outer membrane protein beta-barrel domain-containing protein n=1 Tax=Nannocystis pusilla TaxID=889268 RepID=A0ABS7TWI0_9BACT|nr:hypothetical protein [Nannocystis pusilla]MBZ5712595.1 hypothetical protein [Nannocystis pusilla]
MKLHRLALTVSLVCALGSIANTAEAAKVAPAGKVRVHLDTEVLSWTHGRPYLDPGQAPNPANPRWNVIGFGAGRPVTIDGNPIGGASVIALGVGYGIHRHLILGARFGMNLSHSFDRNNNPDDGENDDSTTSFVGTFTPYIEFLPIAEGPILPFILLRTGFTGATVTANDGPNWFRTGAMAPLVGVGFGAHAFVNQYFSVDFGLTFDYRWVHGIGRAGGPIVPPNTPPPTWGRTAQSFTLAATLGLSTWF